MSISFHDSSSNTATAATSITGTVPDADIDDVLVVSVATTIGAAITKPADFTLNKSQTIALPPTIVETYYRVIDGTEDATYDWSWTGIGVANISMLTYAGVDTSSPIDASDKQSNSSSANVVAKSIDTVTANTMLVGFFVTPSTSTFTPDGGMTEKLDFNATGLSTEVAQEARAATGATGTRTAVASTAAANAAIMLALKEAPAVGWTREVTSGTTTAGTQLTITQSAVAGDVAVIAIANDGSKDFSLYISVAGGNIWQLVRHISYGTIDVAVYCVLIKSSVSSWQINWNGNANAVGAIAIYRHSGGRISFQAAASQTNAADTDVEAPSVMADHDDALVIGIFTQAAGSTFTADALQTEQADVKVGSSISMQLADEVFATKGATGTRTAVASGSADSGAITIVLRSVDELAGGMIEGRLAMGEP